MIALSVLLVSLIVGMTVALLCITARRIRDEASSGGLFL